MKKLLLFATVMLLAFSSVEVVVAYAVNGAPMETNMKRCSANCSFKVILQ